MFNLIYVNRYTGEEKYLEILRYYMVSQKYISLHGRHNVDIIMREKKGYLLCYRSRNSKLKLKAYKKMEVYASRKVIDFL